MNPYLIGLRKALIFFSISAIVLSFPPIAPISFHCHLGGPMTSMNAEVAYGSLTYSLFRVGTVLLLGRLMFAMVPSFTVSGPGISCYSGPVSG